MLARVQMRVDSEFDMVNNRFGNVKIKQPFSLVAANADESNFALIPFCDDFL